MTSTDNRATARSPPPPSSRWSRTPPSRPPPRSRRCRARRRPPASRPPAQVDVGDLPLALADLRADGGGAAADRRGHHQPRRARRLGPRPRAQPVGLGGARVRGRRCVAELRSPRPRIPMLGTATGVLILCTTGMPSVVEPAARFTTAWLIARLHRRASPSPGTPRPASTPGSTGPRSSRSGRSSATRAAPTQLDPVLRWFPPAVVAVWAIGIYALARSMLGGSRAPWVAAWLFVGLNWIEQDYFSPQATGIMLMLTVLTFALGPLATRRTDAAGVPGWPYPHPGAKRTSLVRRWLVAALTPPNRPTLPPRQLLLIYFCAALVPHGGGARAPDHPVRDHRPAGAAGRRRPVPRPRAGAGGGRLVGGVHPHRRPRVLDQPARADHRLG